MLSKFEASKRNPVPPQRGSSNEGSDAIWGTQQQLYLQIHMGENGEDPIGFMGPHYFIHQAAGASISTPPSTAFTPSQIRHAYGFDLVTNQGAGQTIALVDAYDDANA